MCFSEKLADKAHAYQTKHGWVYVAWKAVAVNTTTGDVRPLYRPYSECDYTGERKWGTWGTFQVEELVRDRHGFHVGASPKGAMVAALQFVDYGDEKSRRAETALQAWRRLEKQMSDRSAKEHSYVVRLVRVLVPSASIGDGEHAHSMLMLPPGVRETEADIAECDRENRRLSRALNQREIALSKLREIANGKAVVNVQ